jgi:hypothetical protein
MTSLLAPWSYRCEGGAPCLAPPNKPLKLSILPQGHWCNIDGPARRQARSLTARRSADEVQRKVNPR